ncbi:MAG: ADP/ATP carrier protein [Bacteroidetes bacterium]|nr:ADP/ATP carrier protein [Bacteroidota bacterium]
MNSDKPFGKIRNWLFPIYKKELNVFLPLCVINFCFTFGYSSLRVLKDSFVIGEGGAEALYYLKAYGVTPAVILFTIIYTILSRSFGRDGRFNFVIIYLILFFLIFRLILYPYSQSLKLDKFYDLMMNKIPSLKGLWSIVRNWHTSLFYIHSELWGSYALGISFWTLANDLTSLNQSKRFYGFFPLAGNLGSALAGFFVAYIFMGKPDSILISVLFLASFAFITYNYFFKSISKLKTDHKPTKKIDKTNKKFSFKESFSLLSKSKYLIYIAIIVLCYNMSTSLIESVIKDRWAEYANGNETILTKIGGNQIMIGGILSTILAFFATYLQRKKWIYAALFTPLVFLIVSSLFFSFLYFDNFFGKVLHEFGISNIFASVVLGWTNLVLVKASKYSFFEPTKEATYIPLDEESKIKGKAAVDGVGSRLGKGISSILLTIFILPMGFGKIKNVRHIIFGIVSIVLMIWIWAVKKLNAKFKVYENDK